jgi:hypothetical protein
MSVSLTKKLGLIATCSLLFTLQAQAAKLEFYVSNFGPDDIPVYAGEEGSTSLTEVPNNGDMNGVLVYSKHYDPHWGKTEHHKKTIVIYNPQTKQPICGVEAELVIKEGIFGDVHVGGGSGAQIQSSGDTTYGYCNQPQTDTSGDTVKVYVTAEAFTTSGTNTPDGTSN